MSTENDNIQRIEIFTGHNEKYNIDYKYVKAMFSGSTCEFEYKSKKYGFTSHSKFKDATIKNSKNCTTKMELMPEGENVDRELEKIVDYLELNEKEKKNKMQFDEIDVKNYYLLIVSNKENCFFCDTEVGNKDLEIDAYEHGGIMSDYYIVNYHNKKTKDVCGFSYQILFRTLDFDLLPGEMGLFFKNVGDECLFLRFGNRIIFIRPGEQLKYCEKNFVKDKIRVPECGGREIEEFFII